MAKSNKIQKKSFFEASSTITAAKILLYAASAEELDGRIVRLDLTRNLRGKSLELRLRIKCENGVLTSEPVALELAGSYIRRMMRKGADYVEDSFVAECKDAKLLVKPFMITRNKVSRAVRRLLRNTAREHLITHLKSRPSKEIVTEITINKLQKEMSLKLKKIYPLALCEVRWFEILGEKGKTEEVPKGVKEAVTEGSRSLIAKEVVEEKPKKTMAKKAE